MNKATTESADFLFAVKEHATGTPFIMLQPRHDNLSVVGDGFLSLELREGTSMRQAKEIAQHLNDNIEHVSYTHIGDTRWASR